MRAVEPPRSPHDLHAGLRDLLLDVLALRVREPQDPLENRRQVDAQCGLFARQAQVRRLLHPRDDLDRRAQRFRRHAVPQHARAAKARAIDDGDVGAQLGRD